MSAGVWASRAVSSAVERLSYTQEVGGSRPSPPTNTANECTMGEDIARTGFKTVTAHQYRESLAVLPAA